MQFGVNHLGEVWAGFTWVLDGESPLWVCVCVVTECINVYVCPVDWVNLQFFPLLLLF